MKKAEDRPPKRRFIRIGYTRSEAWTPMTFAWRPKNTRPRLQIAKSNMLELPSDLYKLMTSPSNTSADVFPI